MTEQDSVLVLRPLAVFSKFHVVAGRVKDAIVFYDPRRITPAT